MVSKCPHPDMFDHVDMLTAAWTMDEALPSTVSISADHKTVIVLDHSPTFASASKNKVPVSLKETGSSQMRVVGSMEKSLWSCAVESSLEMHRIIDEVYPDGTRLMRFVVSDFVGRFLTHDWGTKLITLDELIQSFLSCDVPDATADLSSCSIINGISMAVEALSELTKLQKKYDSILTKKRSSSDVKKSSVTKDEDKDSHKKEPTHFTRISPSTGSEKPKATEEEDQQLTYNRSLKQKGQRREPPSGGKSEEINRKSDPNKGSIIVFTSLESDKEVLDIEQHITEEVISRNKVVSTLDADTDEKNFAPISHLNVYIINLFPVNDGSAEKTNGVTAKSLTRINEHLSCGVVNMEAGVQMHSVVHGVVVDHFQLASTTITNIPMKEEAQQGQSVNYDVEIFHPRRSHHILNDLGLIGKDSMLRAHCSPGGYDTIKLAWCTPPLKNRWNQFPRCISALPISPASVNSRPSVCLTSFLLQGRVVMLEVLKSNLPSPNTISPNVSQKLVSHMLMCHADRLYIHTIFIGNHHVLENETLGRMSVLPKTSANLRLSDFSTLMKECQLKNEAGDISPRIFNEQSRKRLRRITRYWPRTFSDSFIYNIPKRFEPLLSLIRHDELSTSDVSKCRDCICSLMTFRDCKEAITAKTFECKTLKNFHSKEEQFRVACKEVLHHLHNYVNHSERHLEVFNMFLQLSGLDRTTNLSVADVTFTSSSDSMVQSSSDEGSSSLEAVQRSSSPADSFRSQSRSNSPLPKKPRKAIHMWAPGERVNLYDLVNERYQREHWSNWKDFAGRIGNKPAKLYPNLDLGDGAKKGSLEVS